jgi:hypothetical protein
MIVMELRWSRHGEFRRNPEGKGAKTESGAQETKELEMIRHVFLLYAFYANGPNAGAVSIRNCSFEYNNNVNDYYKTAEKSQEPQRRTVGARARLGTNDVGSFPERLCDLIVGISRGFY